MFYFLHTQPNPDNVDTHSKTKICHHLSQIISYILKQSPSFRLCDVCHPMETSLIKGCFSLFQAPWVDSCFKQCNDIVHPPHIGRPPNGSKRRQWMKHKELAPVPKTKMRSETFQKKIFKGKRICGNRTSNQDQDVKRQMFHQPEKL